MRRKQKAKKVIYENVRLSHAPNIFFSVCLFNAAYFCTLQEKNNVFQNTKRVFKTCFKAECDILIQNAMFILSYY